jgi:hypothetical protein
VELLPQVRDFIWEAIAGADIVLVHRPDEVIGRSDLGSLMVRQRPSVVIVPPDLADLASECHELFRRHSGLRVLTIATSSSSADLYELRFLGKNVGLGGIVAAIGQVVGRELSAIPGGRSHFLAQETS